MLRSSKFVVLETRNIKNAKISFIQRKNDPTPDFQLKTLPKYKSSQSDRTFFTVILLALTNKYELRLTDIAGTYFQLIAKIN